MSTPAQPKSERFDVCATPAVKQLLQEASQVKHQNVCEFLLDDAQWQAFTDALERPVSSAVSKPGLHSLLNESSILE